MPHTAAAFGPAVLWAWFALLGGLLAAYGGAVYVQGFRGRGWSRGRTAWFAAALALLAMAGSPPVSDWAHHDFRGHMLQHLAIGMFAPLGLVLAAPVTLALRTLPLGVARRLARLLRRPLFRLPAHPATALVLDVGGMYALYLTPLFAATHRSPLLHGLLQLHFLAAGYLFAWVVLAGPDPAPHATPWRTRLAVLFVAGAAHAVLAKLMYGYGWPRGTPYGPDAIRAAAQWMYYGGDLAELLLATAFFARWLRTRKRRPAGAGVQEAKALP